MVHSARDYENAVAASQILFSNEAEEALRALDEKTLLDVLEGVPTFEVARADIEAGVPLLELLAAKTAVFPSKGEARKMVQGNGVSINKEKVTDPNMLINSSHLIAGRYIIAQRGKKNYYLITVE